MIFVSILMPTYNHEKYIKQAIESCLNQKTKYSWELLINDDCSTDKTFSIAKSYAEKYPKQIFISKSDKNEGLLTSYKKLIQKSRGKYLAILESDDIWLNNSKLEKQISFLEEKKDYGLCASDFIRIDQNSNPIDFTNHTFDEGLGGNWFNQEMCQNMLGAVTVVFRKSVYDAFCDIDKYIFNGFNTFDYPVWLEISANSKCKYIHEKLAAYRIISSSISNSGNLKKRIDFENGVTQIQEYMKSKYQDKKIDMFRLKECRNLRYIQICLKFNKLLPFIFYAKKLHSKEFKFRILHLFPIIWYFQHKIRIKK